MFPKTVVPRKLQQSRPKKCKKDRLPFRKSLSLSALRAVADVSITQFLQSAFTDSRYRWQYIVLRRLESILSRLLRSIQRKALEVFAFDVRLVECYGLAVRAIIVHMIAVNALFAPGSPSVVGVINGVGHRVQGRTRGFATFHRRMCDNGKDQTPSESACNHTGCKRQGQPLSRGFASAEDDQCGVQQADDRKEHRPGYVSERKSGIVSRESHDQTRYQHNQLHNPDQNDIRAAYTDNASPFAPQIFVANGTRETQTNINGLTIPTTNSIAKHSFYSHYHQAFPDFDKDD